MKALNKDSLYIVITEDTQLPIGSVVEVIKQDTVDCAIVALLAIPFYDTVRSYCNVDITALKEIKC